MGFVKRYSGQLKIQLAWSDSQDQYACKVTDPSGRTEYVTVRAPAVLTQAVDSPKAYDDAARAAISFLNDPTLQEQAQMGNAGYEICRVTPYLLGRDRR